MIVRELVKKPTILDVAERAGVAVGTVSRFINGQKLRQGNRARIEQAIAELGYRANTVARAMKTERTHTIGFIVPRFDEFNAAILTILVEELSARRYSLLTFNHADRADATREALESAASRRIDGIFLSGTADITETVQGLLDNDMPVVIFNNDIPDVSTDRVLVNDRAATAEAIGRLIAFGHRRIAIVTGDLRVSTGENRLAGYLDALKAAGIEAEDELVHQGNWSRLDGHAAVNGFLTRDHPPSAVFFSSYNMTIGGLECLRAMGKTPGEDLDLVSFDDPDVFGLTTPGITAIQQPTTAVARYLTELMLTRLDGSAPDTARNVLLDCDLKLRGSVGPHEHKEES